MGQGAFAVRLALLARRYLGFEPDRQAYEVAARRLSSFASASVRNEPIPVAPTSAADLLCAFEVLEHLPDDLTAILQWVEWLESGGILVVSVPGRPDCFGRWDLAVGHFRRYTRDDLGALLSGAGLLDVRVEAYGFPLGLFLDFARNHFLPVPERARPADATGRSGRLYQPPDIAGTLLAIAMWPFRLMQRPWAKSELNTGLVAVGRKR